MTRVPCRRRNGEPVLRAENGWFDNGWLQSPQRGWSIKKQSPVRCRGSGSCRSVGFYVIRAKPRLHRKRKKSLQKFLEPSEKPKLIYTGNSLEFGNSFEDFSWNHRTSTPHRSETNGIAERAVRRVKEGPSEVLLQSGLKERCWADSMACYCYLRNVQDLLADWKTAYDRRFEEPFKRANNCFWSHGWMSSDFSARSIKTSSIWQENSTSDLSGMWADRGAILERGCFDSRLGKIWKSWTHRTFIL